MARLVRPVAASSTTRRSLGVSASTPVTAVRRVVELASTGRTNRAIAQALYVTPKTVEVHLSNSYRKLGIRSRRELVEALAAPA